MRHARANQKTVLSISLILPQLILMSLILMSLFGILFLNVASAQTDLIFPDDDELTLWQFVFGVLVGFGFLGATLTGLVQGFRLLLGASDLEPEGKRILRWLALNFLEPGLTAALLTTSLLAYFNVSESGWWFVPPVVSFVGLLLPPLIPALNRGLRTRPDLGLRSAFQRLRLVVIVRLLSVLIASSAFMVHKVYYTEFVGALGVMTLIWCWQQFGKLIPNMVSISQASDRKQPTP
jgi:hypothetical protein